MKRYWVTCDVEVAAPVEKVFEYLTDWPRQGEWMLGTRVENDASATTTSKASVTTTSKEAPTTPGLGDRIRAFTGVGPIGFWDTMTITRWQPPHQVDVVHTGNFIRGIGYMTLTQISPHQTKFDWAEEIELPLGLLGRLGWPVVRPIFLAGIRTSLKKFAHNVESAQPAINFALERP